MCPTMASIAMRPCLTSAYRSLVNLASSAPSRKPSGSLKVDVGERERSTRSVSCPTSAAVLIHLQPIAEAELRLPLHRPPVLLRDDISTEAFSSANVPQPERGLDADLRLERRRGEGRRRPGGRLLGGGGKGGGRSGQGGSSSSSSDDDELHGDNGRVVGVSRTKSGFYEAG